MNKIIAILLSLLVISMACKDIATIIQFEINRDYIAKTFCVNQDMPALMCYGHCYLESTIKQNQEKEQQLPIQLEDSKTNVVFLSDPQLPRAVAESPTLNAQEIFYQSRVYVYSPIKDIFHPPKLSIYTV